MEVFSDRVRGKGGKLEQEKFELDIGIYLFVYLFYLEGDQTPYQVVQSEVAYLSLEVFRYRLDTVLYKLTNLSCFEQIVISNLNISLIL